MNIFEKIIGIKKKNPEEYAEHINSLAQTEVVAKESSVDIHPDIKAGAEEMINEKEKQS